MAEEPKKNEKKSCGISNEFNYCFWAKLLVAIPIFPLAALIGASYFDSLVMQVVGGTVAIIAVVMISKAIDRIPPFTKKIQLRKS